MSTGRRYGIRAAGRRSGAEVRGRAATRRGIGALAAVALVSTALVAQGGVVTNAAWNDAEWAHAPAVGTIDCADAAGAFATRGEGRALSGSLLGIDLDSAAKVSGVRVTNDGSSATPTPAAAAPANSVIDAYADPLDASALNTVNLGLSGLLQLPLDTDTGLIGQYAQARTDGDAVGASGYITNAGGINTDGQESDYPDIATLRLSDLLNSLGYDIGTATQGVTDLSLSIGAVAGRAALVDTCEAIWSGDTAAAVHRDYLAAGLTTTVESPTVAALTGAVDTSVADVQTALNGVLGQAGLLTGVTTSLVNALTNALGLVTGLLSLRVAPNGTSVSLAAVDLHLAPLNDFLAAPIQDDDGILSIDLAGGTVQIDTAALLGAAYGETGRTTLNGLSPNTDIFADPAMVEALTQALGSALTGWIVSVDSLLASAVDLATITVNVEIPFQRCSLLGVGSICLGTWQDAGRIKATVSGTLGQLLDGSATVAVDTSALNLGLIGSLLTPLLGAVTGVLGSVLGPLVGGVLQGPITNNVLPLAKLPADALVSLGGPISGALGSVFTGLSGAGLVSITVNAQNRPSSGGPEPPEWSTGLPSSQYEIAALRIGLLELLPAPVRLYLGRGSVGPVCSAAGTAAGGCAGY